MTNENVNIMRIMSSSQYAIAAGESVGITTIGMSPIEIHKMWKNEEALARGWPYLIYPIDGAVTIMASAYMASIPEGTSGKMPPATNAPELLLRTLILAFAESARNQSDPVDRVLFTLFESESKGDGMLSRHMDDRQIFSTIMSIALVTKFVHKSFEKSTALYADGDDTLDPYPEDSPLNWMEDTKALSRWCALIVERLHREIARRLPHFAAINLEWYDQYAEQIAQVIAGKKTTNKWPKFETDYNTAVTVLFFCLRCAEGRAYVSAPLGAVWPSIGPDALSIAATFGGARSNYMGACLGLALFIRYQTLGASFANPRIKNAKETK